MSFDATVVDVDAATVATLRSSRARAKALRYCRSVKLAIRE
jgi:hypothetical protein